MSSIRDRALQRQKYLRTEVKRSGSDEFTVLNEGSGNKFSPADNIGRLEYLRSMAYPELARGLRLDKSRVVISFRNLDSCCGE
jgi:hypothetical protein